MKQQVINYQIDVIQKQVHYNQSNFRINDPHNYRYGTWNLINTIETYVNNMDYSIKWIGCESHAHVLAFFYCMLMGCLTDRHHDDDLFIRFKYSLYHESKNTLSITEQKIFVEHLGLIEDSKNIAEFLKKSNHLETILIKIFSQRCSQMNRKQNKLNPAIKHSKMEELQWYSAIFPFNNFQLLGEKCSSITINKQIFYIVEEKQCYFVIEEANHQLISCRISQVSNRNKKTKTQVYGQGLEYIDSLKSFQMLESKNDVLHDKNKLMIKSESKQILPVTIQDKKYHKNSENITLDRAYEDERGFAKNNFFATKKKITQSQNQPWVNTSKTNTNSSKQDGFIQKERQRKFDMHDLRTSVKDDRYYRMIGSPKMASQRVSTEKDQKGNSKSKQKKQYNRNYQALPIQMPEILENELSQTNRQNNFIYQSLNPSEELKELKKQLTPKINRVPKFLAKRMQEQVPYTFSSSPIKGPISPTRTLIKKQKSAVFSGQQISMSLNPALIAHLAKQSQM